MIMRNRRNLKTDLDFRSQSSFYIESLPDQIDSINPLIQFSGHLPSSDSILNNNSEGSEPINDLNQLDQHTRDLPHLWFWLIRSNHIPKRQKFVIWFNGGPGCSSLEGAFLEIGPFRVTDPSETDGSVKLVNSPISWSEYTTLLFIDQPAGSGFSYVNDREHVEELSEVADQLVTFLGNFYTHFPEYSNVDTYLAGESYAGQYIPYMARAILDKTTLETPLKGIIIGNAWLNPFVQYPAYLDYLFEKELIVKGSEKGYEAEKAFEGCKRALASEGGDQKVLITECEFALQSILNKASKTVDGLEMTPIPFNVTQFTTEKHPKWPKGTLNVLKYLQQDDVVKAFHADRKKSKWVDCNSTVADEMWTPKSLPSSTLIPNLVSKIKVLFYAGDQDYMCNALGINRSISIMSWNGQTGWGTDSDGNMVQDQDYVINGVKEGSWIQARGMSYVKFDRASHMVPTDLPFATHDMLLRFLEIDPLSSAGPAGQIPSQLGTNGSQIILAKTHRNGSVLMDEIDPKLLKVEPKPLPIGSAPVLETIEEREAYYGPRQTITLLIVMCGSLFGIIVLIKLRRRRRRRNFKRGRASNKALREESLEESIEMRLRNTSLKEGTVKRIDRMKSKIRGGEPLRRDGEESLGLLNGQEDRIGKHLRASSSAGSLSRSVSDLESRLSKHNGMSDSLDGLTKKDLDENNQIFSLGDVDDDE